jgi:hypothetical protein
LFLPPTSHAVSEKYEVAGIALFQLYTRCNTGTFARLLSTRGLVRNYPIFYELLALRSLRAITVAQVAT